MAKTNPPFKSTAPAPALASGWRPNATSGELASAKAEIRSLRQELDAASSRLRASEAELEATTGDLGSLLGSPDIAVIFADRHLRLRRFTPAVADLLVLQPDDIGRPLGRLADKFGDRRLAGDAQSVLETLNATEHEVTLADGRSFIRRVLPHRTPASRADGVVITFVDISERKRSCAALLEAERRENLILESVTDYAIFSLDGDGRIASWNAGAARMLGYSAPEVLGHPLDILFTAEERQAGAPAEELRLARETGSTTQEGWCARKDGSRFWGFGTLARLSDADGCLRGFVKLLRDQTERKFSEEALRHAKQAAEAANEAKDQFLANVSHELRTPLSAMVLWASLIEDEKISEPKQLAEALSAIRRSAEEQRKLIEDLVDTARIVAGKLRLELQDVDIAGVVRDAVEGLRPPAAGKNLELVTTVAANAGTICADPSRVAQLVTNLVGNAIKFTPPGGRVAVSLRREGSQVRIEVADTGAGIPKNFLPELFKRFAQAGGPGTRPESGLGLGLSIVRQIVEMHGGSIQVESEGEGRGATFTVRLPVSESRPPAGSGEPGAEPAPPRLLANRRILIVEDVASTRQALTIVLTSAGAQVAAVDSTAAAWQEFERLQPEVILSDLGLPTTDGFTFIHQIRTAEQLRRVPPIPAVALTAFAGESISQKARESGFQLCLTKPIRPRNLVTVLASLLK